MPTLPSWLRRASQSLASRLDRLRQTFDHLREQLREAVSQHIGQTVASAVREVVHQLLDDGSPVRSPPSFHSSSPRPTRNPRWDEPDDDPWRERDGRWDDDDEPAYRHDPVVVQDDEPERTNLNRAVLVGCEAASWWLRQRWGKLPVLTAFVIGGLSAAVSYVGGPIAAVGVALAGSAVSLITLARTSKIDCVPTTER